MDLSQLQLQMKELKVSYEGIWQCMSHPSKPPTIDIVLGRKTLRHRSIDSYSV